MKVKKNNSKKRFSFWLYLVGGLLVLNLILIGLFYLKEAGIFFISSEKDLRVVFLDIGQGDAALIRTPQGKNILIDGGPDKSIIFKLDRHIPFYRRKIDLMILTHPHPDHLNGLIEVVQRYQVKKIFYNGVKSNIPAYDYFLELIEKKGIEAEIIWLDYQFEIDNAQLIFLYPLESLEDRVLADDNDGSLVFMFIYGQTKILFTGDATKKVEEDLIDSDKDLSADILKVAHHGSKDSSIQEFLDLVEPSYAVISSGKDNKFGHPALRVLRNLENIGAQVLRTDQIGDIIFDISSSDFNLVNFK